MRITKKEILKRAISKYGTFKGLDMLQEECGELVSAINRYKRRRENSFTNMLGEIVDVEIMIAQIKLNLVFGTDVFQYRGIRSKKWKRLKERILS